MATILLLSNSVSPSLSEITKPSDTSSQPGTIANPSGITAVPFFVYSLFPPVTISPGFTVSPAGGFGVWFPPVPSPTVTLPSPLIFTS